MATAKNKSGKGKQERLPGTADGAIEALEQIGFEYAAIRDQRQELLRQEVTLKGRAIDAMHKANRSHYKYGDLEIELVPGEESLKVKVLKPKKEKEGGE